MNETKREIYNATVKRLNRIGAKDPTAQIIALAEEIEQYRHKIRTLEEANAALVTIKRLLERDLADRDEMLKAKVEEVYPEFMRDYKYLEEELDAVYEELAELRKELEKYQPKPLAIGDTVEITSDKYGRDLVGYTGKIIAIHPEENSGPFYVQNEKKFRLHFFEHELKRTGGGQEDA